MPLMIIPESKLWACDNGCGAEFEVGSELLPHNSSELLTQMSSPDDKYLMLVCPSCVFDESLEDWAVDFVNDPRP